MADPAAARAQASGRAFGDGTLAVGQQVDVMFVKGRRTGTTELARVCKVHEDGSVNVEFIVSGERQTNVPAERVQPAAR